MAVVKRSPEEIRAKLEGLVKNFHKELQKGGLREKVLSLIPIFHNLRELGKSFISREEAKSASERILFYFRKYPLVVIKGDEIMVVSAIQEYARRIRELRVQEGWPIVSGKTAREMAEADEITKETINVSGMKPSDYLLLADVQDRDAAHRWHIANKIRKRTDGVQKKILDYFLANVGKPISGEELRYVAKERTEWARRVRELRTEEGWPILTKFTGRPDIEVGVYVLESDRQIPKHDRGIDDDVKGKVLRRDDYRCRDCGWNYTLWNRSDPRHLELHHKIAHVRGGENTPDNLITLCNTCHDKVHRHDKR